MAVSFLTPMLLAGTALVSVPVLLHLLMRQKPVKQEFPAIQFLKKRIVSNRRSLRINHLLLLLARIAAIVLLAFAMARPVVRNVAWLADVKEPVAAVLVFDTAPRMELLEANKTRLEQAVALAEDLFEKLSPSSEIGIIDTAGNHITFSASVSAARKKVKQLTVASPVNSLSTSISEGLQLLKTSERARKELYIFTDCSRGALSSMKPFTNENESENVSILWIDVGAVSIANCAIDSVALSSDQLAVGTSLVITVATTRTGPPVTRGLAVEVLDENGAYVRRAEKPFIWKADSSGQVNFEITGLAPGTRQGRVIILGNDDLPADDVRSFTLDVGAPSKVIIAAPSPVNRTGVFMAQAIAPVALERAGRSRFDAELVDIGSLNAVSWDDTEVIVLVDPPPLPDRMWQQLSEWVAGGKGLIVWLGPQAAEPKRFNSEGSENLLGGRLVRVWRSPDDSNYISPSSLDHPVLEPFRRVSDTVPWQDFPVERHWEFRPNEEGHTATRVVSYRNGLPAVLENRFEEGTVLVVTTSISQAADDPSAWNSLATGFEPWPFVILANEVVLYSMGNQDNRNITSGEPAIIHVTRRDVHSVFVRTPVGDEIPIAVDPKQRVITVSDTGVTGNYAVRSGGGVGGFRRGFSVNLSPSATDFRRLNPEQLSAVLGKDNKLAKSKEDLVRDVELGRIGAEFFGWFILLASCAMLIDWVLANRFYAPLDLQGKETTDRINKAIRQKTLEASSDPADDDHLRAKVMV